MNPEELQRLSVAELISLVQDLQTRNTALQTQIDRTDTPVQDSLGTEPDTLDSSETTPLDEQVYRTSLLLQLSIEFRESLDPFVIIERMLHGMVNNLGISHGSVVLIAPDASVDLAISLRDGHTQKVKGKISRAVLDRGLAGWALRHGRSVVLPDVSRDKRWIPYSEWQRTGSAIVLPIRQAQNTLGVITIFHPETSHFTSHDMLMMEGVAALAGIALGASRRYHEESRQREQSLALFEMSQFLTSKRSYDDVSAMLQEKSVSIFGVDYGLLFLSQEEKTIPSSPISLSPVGLPAAMLQTPNKPILRQATMAVKKACDQKSIVNDVDFPDAPNRSVMAIPLLRQGEAIGAVALIRASGNPINFSTNMWSMLTTFTNIIAATCANMKYAEQFKHFSEKTEDIISQRIHLVQNSRNLLRVVFDNLPEGLILLDPQEVILAANNAFCYPVVGRHPRKVVGQDMPSIWEELEQRGEVVVEMLSPSQITGIGGRDSSAMRVLCATSIGQKRWYEVHRMMVLGEDTEAEYYIERWVDITKQQHLEEQLIAQDRRNILGHLASRVVHDMEVPIQEMHSHLSTCQKNSSLPNDVQETITTVSGAVNRIERTLKSLSHLYQDPNTTWECININQLLQELEALTETQFTHHKITIRFDLASENPLIYAQTDALRQVFLGLLFNAQEAMLNGGEIVVRSYLDRGEEGSLSPLFHVRIRDTGKGMSPEEVVDLFEPFQSTKSHGVGIGLYMSKQIIEQHTGRIEVSSTEGEGTVVDVYLPLDERCRDDL